MGWRDEIKKAREKIVAKVEQSAKKVGDEADRVAHRVGAEVKRSAKKVGDEVERVATRLEHSAGSSTEKGGRGAEELSNEPREISSQPVAQQPSDTGRLVQGTASSVHENESHQQGVAQSQSDTSGSSSTVKPALVPLLIDFDVD